MNRVRPGLLYAAPEMLRLVRTHGLDRKGLITQFGLVNQVRCQDILELAIDSHWIVQDATGRLAVTARGETICAIPDIEAALRQQLHDVVVHSRPTWALRLLAGRSEMRALADADVVQCFTEAGLLTSYDQDVVQVLDAMQTAMRGKRNDDNLASGRFGERLTIVHEELRTAHPPEWIAIDTNRAGYDILSREDGLGSARLPIECKASTERLEEGVFYLSRNEWNQTSAFPNYTYHLWSLKQPYRLLVVPHQEVGPHIPTDGGTGVWDRVKIPYSPFLHHETALAPEVQHAG